MKEDCVFVSFYLVVGFGLRERVMMGDEGS